MMPSVFRHDRKSLFILTVLLLVVAIVQAQNMFQFPYLHAEEGTQVANGWALRQTGTLSPYTYSYEDPPGGILVLAAWDAVTGDQNTFGFPINSGRVLMLGIHVITVALIYLITKKVSRNDLAATVAALIFAFSPLSTAMQRVVYMENIMMVWLLWAFYLAIGDDRTLWHYFASAFFLGMAVLTEESAIFFLPALLFSVRMSAHPHHRRFAATLWLCIALLVASFLPLYAQLKQELFAEGTLLGGDFPHVSLLERLGERGPDTGRFLDYGSGLSAAFEQWVDFSNPISDPVLLYIGLINCIFLLLLALDHREIRPVLGMLVAEGVHLLFGGPVYVFEVILLLPFLALGIGVVVGVVEKVVSRMDNGFKYVISPIVVIVLLYPFWSFYSGRLDNYTQNQIDGQIEAAQWVANNLPADALIVTDDYAFVALRQTHPNTHSFWRVDTDPEIKFELLDDNTCNIDYVVATPQVFSDIQTFNLELMRRTIEQSEILFTYDNGGWPVEIRQVRKTNCTTAVAGAEVN
jgi:4-amino-4-deoxy-L-arabinose transferase-like glycosyltransferase